MAYKSKFGNRPAPSLTRKLAPWLGIAAIVILIDQLAKIAIQQTMQPSERIHIIPGLFDLTLLYNNGAAFSFLNGAGGWQRWFFTAIAGIAALCIVYWLAKYGGQRMFSFGLALILGGALGNVIDRLVYGHVVDFLLFYWTKLGYFPAFNVADSGITVGVIILGLDEFLRVRRSQR